MSRDRWQWITRDDEVLELSLFVDGIETIKGMSGRGMPPIQQTRIAIPGQPGGLTTSVRHGVREIDLPLHVTAANWAALQDLQNTMVTYLDPTRGAGTLRFIDGDDSHNSDLICRYVSGLTFESDGDKGPGNSQPTLIFQADDPYWYGEYQSQSWTGGAPVSFFPNLPINMAGSIIGDATITNYSPGDVWPIWTFVGPGFAPTLINNTTGKTLEFAPSLELDGGDSLVIDTRPNIKSVTGPNGTDWRAYLSQRSMWPLVKGDNEITLSLTGSTSSSYISVLYREWQLTP